MAKQLTLILLSFSVAALTVHCAKPADEHAEHQAPATETSPVPEAGLIPPAPLNPIPVKNGKLALLATQCPYGASSDPKELEIALWGGVSDEEVCPINLTEIEFTQPFQPIELQASCRKKTLNARAKVRTQDNYDGFWLAQVNGNFSLTADRIVGRLKVDNSGNQECYLPVKVDISGQMKCLDPNGTDDKLNLENLQAFYRPADIKPEEFESWNIPKDAKLCDIPKKCYFWTHTELKQCQN